MNPKILPLHGRARLCSFAAAGGLRSSGQTSQVVSQKSAETELAVIGKPFCSSSLGGEQRAGVHEGSSVLSLKGNEVHSNRTS